MDDVRLTRLLGDPDLAWLVARVRRRLELGKALDGIVTLTGPTPAQRRAVHGLLGRSPRSGRSLSVSLPVVDELLRRSGACPDGLETAVTWLGGPVVVQAAAANTRAVAWEEAFAGVTAAVVAAGRPELVVWLARLRTSGVVKRLEPDPIAAGVLLGRLTAVLGELPAQGEPIGRFAARVAGGAHALDDGQPLATLSLGVARALGGLDGGPLDDRDHEPVPETRREIWASVGLLRDELSSVVLCAGLPADPNTPAGAILTAGCVGGEPVVLTLRQLVRARPRWPVGLSGQVVHVCENPVVVALAADRLGTRCPPLVCTHGQPGAAVMVLLRALVEAGARLLHHGDFDWGGARIGNVLHARLPIEPWRFDHLTYERAVARTPGPPLRGPEVMAVWDPHLAGAMRRSGRAVEEESVIDDLLDDLANESTRWG